MPPNRSHVKPFTPVKTERSHQENQERAYVAASRRSDRSLEARIESARRASEIHKQRTGRSLRITEAAVLNEEMYEEDDDDLPAHMRRLTAHLRLNQQDADLDRRLGSLLVSQIGIRQALPITQQPSFYRYSPSMFQTAFAPTPSTQSPLGLTSPLSTNWNIENSGLYSRQNSMSKGGISPSQVTKGRVSPYPIPQSPHMQPQSPNHTSLLSPYPQKASSYMNQNYHQRQDSAASVHRPSADMESQPSQDSTNEVSPFVYGSPLCQDPESTIFPFTSSLPLETQQILAGSNLDFGDPAFSMFMPSPVDLLQDRSGSPVEEDKEQLDEPNDEQFGAFWNDVILGV